MQERAIHISSVNRQKIGRSRPEDFIIKFDPPLKLDTTMRHELAVDRVSMTYSWHNVNAGYNNNTIKYSPDNGTKWKTITFVDGMYSYDDLDDYITQSIIQNGDKPSSSKGINLYFVLSSYRVVIELDNQWKLDIRNSNFGVMIPTENLTRSYPFTFEPKRALFSPVSKSIISEMGITVTDALGRPIDLNGINWFMSLTLRSSLI